MGIGGFGQGLGVVYGFKGGRWVIYLVDLME